MDLIVTNRYNPCNGSFLFRNWTIGHSPCSRSLLCFIPTKGCNPASPLFFCWPIGRGSCSGSLLCIYMYVKLDI